MAIAVEITYRGPGLTIDKYFQSIQELGVSPEGAHPDPSCLFHWVSADPNGYVVTDVWTDGAALDKFIAEKIAPVMKKFDIPEPHVKFTEVANYLTAGS